MKKGPLSKKEKAFITEHKKDDIKSIASELNRSVSVIERFHSTLEEEALSKAGDLMARNRRYGVVTMTEGASMAGDENRKKSKETKPDPVSPRLKGSIHKFREE
tara:strand:- start:3508 stop:3819 length:312 start_codon:yes stop_codon:yes gene_type:complete